MVKFVLFFEEWDIQLPSDHSSLLAILDFTNPESRRFFVF